MNRGIPQLLAIACWFVCPAYVHCQTYPTTAISLVIPLAPGDASDVAGRIMADELTKLLKVPVVVVNKPGAGGALGTNSVVTARKDGYTLLIANNAALIYNRVLTPESATYDPFKDLTPLGLATRTPILIAIRQDAPYKNFNEMVEFAKKHPGNVRLGTAGAGSVGHFTVEIINALTGADLTMVPFKGAAPGITALLGGHVEGVVLALGALSSHLKSGTLRGVVISSKFPEFADIPTLTELGYRQNLLGVWLGFFAPAGVPPEVTKSLIPAVEKAVKNPAVGSKLTGLGMVQDYAPPDKLLSEIRQEHRTVEEIAKKAGLVK
jgi:tripartite-type tricarboxylate transporter receptor subunit TctC